jgi:fructose-bisphosphate aldolase / 6-deoxy-5-ketofructose 1-phosphate synthase
MFTKQSLSIMVPADVPNGFQKEYVNNYRAITRNSNFLFLFSCDQKIEHLHTDFLEHAYSIEHLFTIATHGTIGAMATHLGLIARYGMHYHTINYIVKLTARTNSVPLSAKDPYSAPLWSVDDVLLLKKQTNLAIRGIGCTLYLGSEFEETMLAHTAQLIFQAHQHGLVAIVWIYPRGKHLSEKDNPELIAGAAGVAASLGADFVKVHVPQATATRTSEQWLSTATYAAGNTKIICAGGQKKEVKPFLESLYAQMQQGKSHGCAVGRNIFQRPLPEALALTNALSALVYDHATVEHAYEIYQTNRQKDS